ncbi:MAG: Mor transcription activator family protein [Kiritimatiellales bacterium]
MSEFSFMNGVPALTITDEPVDTSEFTALLQEVARVIGFESALDLVDKLGGLDIVIPKEPDEKHNLTKAVGLETAQKLAAVFGGERITVPREHHYFTVIRQAEVRRRYNSGESMKVLAREYNCSERAISKMIWRENRRRTTRRYNKIMGRS